MAFVDLSSIAFTSGTIVTLVVFACVVVLYLLFVYRQKNGGNGGYNYPPGPPGLPLLGNILSVGKEGWFDEQVKKYGDIFTWKMGPLPIIYLHGKALREALNKGNVLSNRAPIPTMYDYFKDRGIVGASFHGPWKIQRGFVSRLMQSFQLGTTAGQEPILKETGKLLELLRKQNGEAFDSGTVLQLAMANIICSFVSNRQFEYDDANIIKLITNMRTCVSSISYKSIGMFFPKVAKAPIIGVQEFFTYFDALRAQQRDEINNHMETLDRNKPRDFIDHYLIEMENNGEADGFTIDNLEIVTVDLFMAGTETSAGAIYWCLLMLQMYPDVQTKLQQELDRVIPKDNEYVTMEDQIKCPYTQAVIYETLRFASIAPAAMRMCTEEFEFEQYKVPKDTFVMVNYMNTHHSNMLWSQPKEFRPERFLSKEDPVRLIKQDFLMPFSTGRRNCLGERLARAELFLVISNIFRNLDIRVPHGNPRPEVAVNQGLTRVPKPFKICFIPRERVNQVETVKNTERCGMIDSQG